MSKFSFEAFMGCLIVFALPLGIFGGLTGLGIGFLTVQPLQA